MSSLNVVIKSTVFPEWFSHILPEWYAYVPTKVDYSDLYSILSFFRGSMDGKGGHDEVARRIALNGQCWVEKTLRYEDLQVYMFRLYLEYARLTSPDRDNGKMVSCDASAAVADIRTLFFRTTISRGTQKRRTPLSRSASSKLCLALMRGEEGSKRVRLNHRVVTVDTSCGRTHAVMQTLAICRPGMTANRWC